MAKSYDIVTEAPLDRTIDFFLQRGYLIESDLRKDRLGERCAILGKGDVIMQVLEMPQFWKETYDRHMSHDELYVRNPSTFIQSKRAWAAKQKRTRERKTRDDIWAIERKLIEDLNAVNEELKKAGYNSHFYSVYEKMTEGRNLYFFDKIK